MTCSPRIADGLGVPRGYLGLAYDESTQVAVELAATPPASRAVEQEEARQLLAHAANVTMEVTVDDMAKWWQPVDRQPTPAPARIGQADIDQVEQITAALRGLDFRFGGGACRDAIVAQVASAQRLLHATYSEQVGRRLHLALADLHNLAGWASLDVGLPTPARRHFARALEQARVVDDASLIADVLCRMGRLHQDRGMLRVALRFFQLAQIAAQDSGDPLTVAMVCADEAWVYALLDDPTQAFTSLARAQDEYARAGRARAPWLEEFDEADLHAMAGRMHVSLPRADETQLARGIELLSQSTTEKRPEYTRGQVFNLTFLATAYIRAGDYDPAERAAREALGLAASVRSARTLARLEPLQVAARQHAEAGNDLADIAHEIAALRTA